MNPQQDVAHVTARDGEVNCSAFLCWCYPGKTRKLVAVGEMGILEWDLSWTYILLHRKWVENAGDSRFEHFDEGDHELDVEDRSVLPMNEALHFAKFIRNGSPPEQGANG